MSAPEAVYDDFPIRIRELQVLRRTRVTPRMLRVTLGGPDLAGFESHQSDEHVKLVFPDPGTDTTRHPVQDDDHLDWPSPFPPTRDYTVRRYDPAAGEHGEVDVDLVDHDGGLAATWARTCEVGSSIWVAGPRPSLVVPAEFGFHVLVGDETALPAIGRWLEELPADARGAAFVEVAGPEEEQQLRVPDGVRLEWLHRGSAAPGTTSLLADAVDGLQLPTDTHVYVWAYAEAGCIKPVRRWARARAVGRGQSDIGGYWKLRRTGAVPTGVLSRLVHRVEHELEELRDR